VTDRQTQWDLAVIKMKKKKMMMMMTMMMMILAVASVPTDPKT